jgi:serine phosphatase RsbU (regulator of sigma subunit)/tetratricopeptide (TPR) repeat protein
MYLLLAMLFSFLFISAQSTLFLKQLNQLPKNIRADFLRESFEGLYKKDSVKAVYELNQCSELFSGVPDIRAACFSSQAFMNNSRGNFQKAIGNENSAMLIYDSLGNYELSTTSLINMYRYCINNKREDTILTIYYNRLKMVEGNAILEMVVNERIGVHFKENFSEEKALKYLERAYQISKKVDLNGKRIVKIVLGIYKNLGVLYRNKKDFERAEFLFDKGVAVAEEFEDFHYKGILLNSLGVLYRETGVYVKAITALEESIRIKEGALNKLPLATTLSNLGGLYLLIDELQKAEKCLKQAEEIVKESKDIKRKLQAYNGLFELYKKKNDVSNAFPYAVKVIALKDSSYKQDLAEENAKLEAMFNSAKKQKEVELAEFKNKQLESNIQMKNRENKVILLGLSVLIVLLIWSLFSYVGKRKANKELELKNTLVVTQKIKVEEQHKEIIDSITYAKRLQEGILPSEQLFTSVFNDFFIFYKPKDIVAGDFYWMEIKNDFVFVAVADCTGHGVPGALVSMVCYNALNRCVYEFNLNDPGEILDKTRELVLQSFVKGGMDVKDGMDISLIAYNRSAKNLLWAGANNPLWYFNSSEFGELKGDKQPIGKSYNYKTFTTHRLQYIENMRIYLFSDGYADQFGGVRGKKLMNKRFAELLQNVQSEKMTAQKKLLDTYFTEWQGKLDQLDDVCVVGIEFV